MTIQVIFHHADDQPLTSRFLMARHSVVDRHQEMVAFKLVFREASTGSLHFRDSQTDTCEVLPDAGKLNFARIVGDLRCFINIDADLLQSDLVEHLPRSQVVCIISNRMEATEPLLQRIGALRENGFVFALSDIDIPVISPLVSGFLPLADIVIWDLHKMTLDQIAHMPLEAAFARKKRLADNVETPAQFEHCLLHGFDYFQGYYFAQPVIAPDSALTPTQVTITDVMALITADAESAAIEERVKQDVSLGLNLLRLVNTAALGAHRIDSLRQALMMMGRNQLLSWMQVMLYTQAKENAPSVKPLLIMATTRGKLLELITQRHRLGNRSMADTAFTVGIMSLMDTLFNLPMTTILRQIAVVQEVSNALLYRQGYFGDLLRFVEATERLEDTEHILQTMRKFQLTCPVLHRMQAEAFDWSNEITRSIHH